MCASLVCLQGKLDTEKLLTDRGVPFTSVRPVYIYGPLKYNPVEEWFFDRIKAGRPIPVPNSGKQARLHCMCFFCACVAMCVWTAGLSRQALLASVMLTVRCHVTRLCQHVIVCRPCLLPRCSLPAGESNAMTPLSISTQLWWSSQVVDL